MYSKWIRAISCIKPVKTSCRASISDWHWTLTAFNSFRHEKHFILFYFTIYSTEFSAEWMLSLSFPICPFYSRSFAKLHDQFAMQLLLLYLQTSKLTRLYKLERLGLVKEHYKVQHCQTKLFLFQCWLFENVLRRPSKRIVWVESGTKI